jgi:hypothetical protein
VVAVTPSARISGATPPSQASNAALEAMYALQRRAGKSIPSVDTLTM